MEWDHLPGAKKTFVIADVRRSRFSRERVLRELESCDLVCANCHRERTFSRMKMVRPKPRVGLEPTTAALRELCSTN
jgi:hypothetical protein